MISKSAVFSFVLGILSWIAILIEIIFVVRYIFGEENSYDTVMLTVGLVIALLAVGFGIFSVIAIKKNKLSGENYAVWGIVLGAVPLFYEAIHLVMKIKLS